MVTKLAEFLARKLVDDTSETEKEYRIYRYSLLFYFSTITQITMILLVAHLLGIFHEAWQILLFYIPIRAIGGGFHHKYMGNCTLLSTIEVILLSLFSHSNIIDINRKPYIQVLFIILFYTIVAYIPRDSIYMKPTNRNTKLSKKVYIAILLVYLIFLHIFPSTYQNIMMAVLYSCIQCHDWYYSINVYIDNKIKINM